MCETIAGADDKIGKGVIGMEFKVTIRTLTMQRFRAGMEAEIDGNQMAGYLLGGVGKSGLAVIAKEFDRSIIRAADLEQAGVKMSGGQVVKPFAGIDGVYDLYSFNNLIKNVLNFYSSQGQAHPKQLQTETKI